MDSSPIAGILKYIKTVSALHLLSLRSLYLGPLVRVDGMLYCSPPTLIRDFIVHLVIVLDRRDMAHTYTRGLILNTGLAEWREGVGVGIGKSIYAMKDRQEGESGKGAQVRRTMEFDE